MDQDTGSSGNMMTGFEKLSIASVSKLLSFLGCLVLMRIGRMVRCFFWLGDRGVYEEIAPENQKVGEPLQQASVYLYACFHQPSALIYR